MLRSLSAQKIKTDKQKPVPFLLKAITNLEKKYLEKNFIPRNDQEKKRNEVVIRREMSN